MDDNSAQIEQLAKQIRRCKLCQLYKTRTHALPGEGDVNSELMFIAQAPGREEDQKGRMFVGPSGKVLDELFAEIGLQREQVYMTNMVKCFLPKCRKPKQEEINTCNVYLKKEIELGEAETLIPLGYHSTKHLLSLYKQRIPDKHHFSALFGQLIVAQDKKILPLHHPATVVHGSSTYEQLLNEYRKINVVTQTCRWFYLCPIKKFYDTGRLSKEWIDQYCKGDWEACIRFQKEEHFISHPDNMLPNGNIDQKLDE
ncbi:MAG: uracil-DNA glycosylase [Bacteroidales bacterium]